MISQKFKQTEIGRIPMEWKVVRLENMIKEIRNGFASGKRDDNGIIQIRMNNVTTYGRLIFDSFIKVPIPENINDFLLKENDFLFNNTNSIDLVGKSAIFRKTPFPCTFSNHFTLIRFTEDVLPAWVLFHFISLWRKGYFKSVAIRHVGQSAVQTKFLTNIKLPLPPLPEQQKIAEILATADEAIQKVDEAIEKTERFKKGLMQELLTGRWQTVDSRQGKREFKKTEIGRIPKEWEVVKLEDIAEISTGSTPSTRNQMYYEGNIPFIKTTEINNNIISETSVFITEKAVRDHNLKIYPANTIFLAMYGQGKTRGKVSLLNISATTSQNAAAIVLNFKLCDPIFIWYYLLSKYKFLRQTGIHGQISHLNLSFIKKFKLPLAPFPEQQKISEILRTVDRKLDSLREKKERVEKIKKGLMNELLTGRKRVTL
jgi:type I restriction enzyme S subunit